jgi:hypothetical protein
MAALGEMAARGLVPLDTCAGRPITALRVGTASGWHTVPVNEMPGENVPFR